MWYLWIWILGVCEMGYVLVIFECLVLTRAFAVTHVCDCGVIWRLMVLGAQQRRAGARAFHGEMGEGGLAMLGWWVCDAL